MSDWAPRLVAALNSQKQAGGVQNIMQPATLVSVNPPIVSVCGVEISKQLHVNQAIRSETELQTLTDAFDVFTEKFKELEEKKDTVTEPKQVIELLQELLYEPMQEMFQAIIAFHEKELVHPGDQVMVRQDGNDIHVMTGTGGGV